MLLLGETRVVGVMGIEGIGDDVGSEVVALDTSVRVDNGDTEGVFVNVRVGLGVVVNEGVGAFKRVGVSTFVAVISLEVVEVCEVDSRRRLDVLDVPCVVELL